MKDTGSCLIFLLPYICICLSPPASSQQTQEYVVHGPTETSGIERDLFRISAGLEYAIPPRRDLLDYAVRINLIPRAYIDEATRGMVFVLHKELLPPKIEDLDWRGLKNFKPSRNFLVTEYTVPAYETRFVIYACPRKLKVNVFSKSLFNAPPDKLADQDILQVLDKILVFPPEKIASSTVEKAITTAGGAPVCYGKTRCNYEEGISPLKEKRWWSLIGFVFLEGQGCFLLSTHDYEHAPIPPSDLGLWEF